MTRPFHILFVCNANRNRSATAEHVARSLGLMANSVGCRPDKLEGRAMTGESIDQAQKIVCMEPHHKDAVLAMRPDRSGDIYVWDILDVYWYCKPELIQLIAEKLKAAPR